MNVEKILRAGLLGHCVFCLRKIGKEVPQPKVLILDILHSFNEVWNCLRSQCPKTGSDNDGGEQLDIKLQHFVDTGSSATFHSIPCICEACAGTVQAVGELLKALRTHWKTLFEVILASRRGGKHSKRSEQFEIQLRECCTEGILLTSTLELLNSICSTEIQATTVKAEPFDEDDHSIVSGYTEELDNFDGEGDLDPDCIPEGGKDEVTFGKEEVYMDTNTNGPEEENCSKPILTKRKKGSRRPYSQLKHPCPVFDCGKTFQKKSRLSWHQRSCHPETIPPEVPKFPCTCGQAFFLKRDLDLHIKTDLETHPKPEVQPREQQLYTCDMCGNRVDKKDRLQHIINHVGEDNVVKCPNEKCSVMVTNSTALRRHVIRNQDCKKAAGKKFGMTCETCGVVEEGRGQLKSHIRSVHERSAEKNYKCPVTGCEMRYCVRQSVDLHLSAHNNLRKITNQTCEYCSQSITIEEMRDHLKSSHQAGDVVCCPQCPFTFPSRMVLLEHMWDHRQLGILCDICNDGVKYPRFSEFRQHYYSSHQIGEKKWSCDQCNMEYFSRLSLAAHVTKKHTTSGNPMASKKAPIEKKYSCELGCHAVKFANRQALEVHEINVHGKDPFTCETCQETFTNSTALNNHKREHAGVKVKHQNWKCEVEGCGKVYTRKRTLKTHMEYYHEEKRFVCDLCGKAYFEEKMLKGHHDRVHLKLRSCVCDECGEGFVNAAVLNKHKLIHTGERPFACEICGQRFRQKEVLKRHLDAHEKKGDNFKGKGPMKQIRKRTNV